MLNIGDSLREMYDLYKAIWMPLNIYSPESTKGEGLPIAVAGKHITLKHKSLLEKRNFYRSEKMFI